MSDPRDQIAQQMADRQLSTRDKRLYDNLNRSPEGADQEAMAQDLTPQNIEALGRAIDAAKDPQQKAILLEELERLKNLGSNLLGPVETPQMPQSLPPDQMQRLPYDPRMQPQRPQMTVPMQPATRRFSM